MHTAPLTALRDVSLFMRSIALFILVAFAGLVLEPTVAAAQTTDDPFKISTTTDPKAPSAEEQLSKAVQGVQERVERMRDKLGKKQDTTQERDELKTLKAQIEQLNSDVETRFAQTGKHLTDKKLPEVIQKRHADALAQYRKERDALLQNLDSVQQSRDDNERQATIERAKKHLDSKQHKRTQQPFDPNSLPFGSPDGNVRKPKKTKKEFQALFELPKPVQIASVSLFPGILSSVVAAATLPQAADLAATEDVQITPEIQALATQLEHNPVKIYNWVHDNIEFLPTYGSIQGSQMTLESRKGNAFDTASLLVALLRASNIPARYAYGTIKVPADKVMNWVGGVTVPEAALDVLGQGGVPSAGIVSGGKITHIEMEHVWVEAYVDFVPSRGAKHKEGDTWVPLDGSFKQYQYKNGIDLKNAINFDAQAFIDQITQTAQINTTEGWATGVDQMLIQNTFTGLQTQLQNYIQTTNPTATAQDILGAKTIVPAARSSLAASLPYSVTIVGNQWTEIPDNLKHKFKLEIFGTGFSATLGPALSFEQPLPKLAGKKMTLAFSPAADADREYLDSLFPAVHSDGTPVHYSEWPTSIPGHLVRLVAELRIDGQLVASGGNFPMGEEFVMTKSLYGPAKGWSPSSNTFVAGNYFGIEVSGAGISQAQLSRLKSSVGTTQAALGQSTGNAQRDNLVGDTVYGTVVSYFGLTNALNDLMGRFGNTVVYPLPSFGSFFSNLRVNYLFGLPTSVRMGGAQMDIDRQAEIAVSKIGDKKQKIAVVQTMGMLGSSMEHEIPQQVLSIPGQPVDGISAVKAITLASQQGKKIYRLDKGNVDSVLPTLTITNDIKSEISTAVAAGKVATVPESNITFNQWTGIGYIIFDPITGSGAYKISGGRNGGDIALLVTTTIYQLKESLHVLVGGNPGGEWGKFIGPLSTIIQGLFDLLDLWEACANAGLIVQVALAFTLVAFTTAITAVFAFLPGLGAAAGLGLGMILSLGVDLAMTNLKGIAGCKT